jgi:hypothetical protein
VFTWSASKNASSHTAWVIPASQQARGTSYQFPNRACSRRGRIRQIDRHGNRILRGLWLRGTEHSQSISASNNASTIRELSESGTSLRYRECRGVAAGALRLVPARSHARQSRQPAPSDKPQSAYRALTGYLWAACSNDWPLKSLRKMVGVAGFEPTTPSPPD